MSNLRDPVRATTARFQTVATSPQTTHDRSMRSMTDGSTHSHVLEHLAALVRAVLVRARLSSDVVIMGYRSRLATPTDWPLVRREERLSCGLVQDSESGPPSPPQKAD